MIGDGSFGMVFLGMQAGSGQRVCFDPVSRPPLVPPDSYSHQFRSQLRSYVAQEMTRLARGKKSQ